MTSRSGPGRRNHEHGSSAARHGIAAFLLLSLVSGCATQPTAPLPPPVLPTATIAAESSKVQTPPPSVVPEPMASASVISPLDEEPGFVGCTGEPVLARTDDFRVMAMGDLVFAGTASANRDAFADVRELLSRTDFVFANLEGVITAREQAAKAYIPGKSYAFRFPVSTADLLKDAGIHAVTVANNHSNDYGPNGFSDSRSHLRAAGIANTGLKGEYEVLEKRGVKVALVAFGFYSRFNDINDLPAARQLVSEARKNADLVIVTFHGGAEGRGAALLREGPEVFFGEQRGDSRAFARTVIAAGADIVVGHGPHVLRAAECIDGKPVIYSLANFVSVGGLNSGGLAEVTAALDVLFDEKSVFRGARLVSMRFGASKLPVRDVTGRAVHLVNELGERAAATIPDFRPLHFAGYEQEVGAYRQWLKSTGALPPLVEGAVSLIGTRYRRGGNLPEDGFDCSGFIRYLFSGALGVDLPRTASEMSRVGRKISMDELQAGDLVFFNTLGKPFSHVGLYVGEGQFAHAPSRGEARVRIDRLADAYYRNRYEGARRVMR